MFDQRNMQVKKKNKWKQTNKKKNNWQLQLHSGEKHSNLGHGTPNVQNDNEKKRQYDKMMKIVLAKVKTESLHYKPTEK